MAAKQIIFRDEVRAKLLSGISTLAVRVYGDGVEREPCKVTRMAFQNAASIAALALTAECRVAQVPEDKHSKQMRETADLM